MPLLSATDKYYVGDQAVDSVWVGNQKIWPSGAFSPDSISGLALWFDASGLPAGNVSTWPNRVAGGANLVTAGTPEPKISISTNGMQVVRYAVNEGRHRILSGSGVSTEWTIIWAGRLVGPTHARVVTGVYTPNNILIGYWNGFEDVAYDNGFMAPSTQIAATHNWRMYSADGTATGPLARIYNNGVLLGSATTGQGWGGTLAVSGYSAAGADETSDAEVGEILMYNRKLSDADRQKAEKYLRDKWLTPPAWTPATIPGLGLWLEADRITGLADGAGVTTWLDASGNGRNATPVAGVPQWRAAAMNGHPSVKFTNSRMTVAGWGTALSGKSEYTMFQVLSQQSFGNYPVIVCSPTYTTWNWIAEFAPAPMGGIYWGHINGNFHLYDAQMPQSTPALLTYSYATGAPRLFKNGTQITTYSVAGSGLGGLAVPAVGADVLLGGYYEGSYPLDDHVAAMIWYDRALSDVERLQVESYLKTKWGLP